MPVERPLVAAVVLAAGSSTRMGRNKLLLELGGETVVRRAVRTAVEAGVDRWSWSPATRGRACARSWTGCRAPSS